MQDIGEESEHDLQSVFNKISESLKTINQETIEIKSSEITAKKFLNDLTESEKSLTYLNSEISAKNVECFKQDTSKMFNQCNDQQNIESTFKESNKVDYSSKNDEKNQDVQNILVKDKKKSSENLGKIQLDKIDHINAKDNTMEERPIKIGKDTLFNLTKILDLEIDKEKLSYLSNTNSGNVLDVVAENNYIGKNPTNEPQKNKLIIEESDENAKIGISYTTTERIEDNSKKEIFNIASPLEKLNKYSNTEIFNIGSAIKKLEENESEKFKIESTVKGASDPNFKNENLNYELTEQKLGENSKKENLNFKVKSKIEISGNISKIETLNIDLTPKALSANSKNKTLNMDPSPGILREHSKTGILSTESITDELGENVLSINSLTGKLVETSESKNTHFEIVTKECKANSTIKSVNIDELTEKSAESSKNEILNIGLPTEKLEGNFKLNQNELIIETTEELEENSINIVNFKSNEKEIGKSANTEILKNLDVIQIDIDTDEDNTYVPDPVPKIFENENKKHTLVTETKSTKQSTLNARGGTKFIEKEVEKEILINTSSPNDKQFLQNEKESKSEPTVDESMIINLDDSDEENNELVKENVKDQNQSKVLTEIISENQSELMKANLDMAELESNKTNDAIPKNSPSKVHKETEKNKFNNNVATPPSLNRQNESSLIIDLDDDDSNEEKITETTEENETMIREETKIEKNHEDEIENVEIENKIVIADNAQLENVFAENNKKQNQSMNKVIESIKRDSKDCVKEVIQEKSNDLENKIELNLLEKRNENGEKYTFHNKECIHYECKKTSSVYYVAPIFVLIFYRVTVKPNVSQYVCDECYETVVNKYEEWCNILQTHQPLLLTKIPQKTNEYVEILDSSDEDDINGKKGYIKKSDFNEETIDLIQKELNDVISTVLSRTEIQNQLTWSKTLLQHRIAKIKEDSDWINETLSTLQTHADKMNNTLYQCPKIEMKILAPLDLNSGKSYVLGESTLANQLTIPPIGEINRPSIVIGGEYYAAKNKVIASWLPSKVVEIVDPPFNEKMRNMKFYKVRFFKIKLPTYKSVPAKHLAFVEVPKVQLSIGTRVIALFDASTLYKTKECRGHDIRSAFYPGVIAEALQPYNNYRYLIFFDDGYTQYVHHCDVRLICEVSANVWDDIHPGSRDFIQNYLINYKKNRPMVQVKKGQSMVTELNGKWIYAKVVDVDASLIQMLFEGQKNHTEWIYRGSTRLGPLFKAIQKTSIPQITRLPRRSEPFVRYMQDDENVKQQSQQQQQHQHSEPPQSTMLIRSQVARKSTARQESLEPPAPATVKHLNNSTIFVDDEEPKGTLIYYSSKSENNPPPRTFRPHMCGPHCILREHFEGHYGVLSKPLLNSWERSIYKIKTKKTSVVYRSPCGRNLRNIEEVHKYLRLTRNELNVENFVFDPDVGCLNEYQVKKCIVNKSDITEGREKIPIQCVNYYDHTMPPDCEYSADRIPTEGVNLNLDTEFLVGCDCKDDCTDKSKCSCWQLTLEGSRYGNPHTPIENIGYHYKRLLEPVTTGIYECNKRCKCSNKCINRVVQHSLETKLQVFKTSNRGWGLRCINDVPKGAFICIYAGNLLTEQKANECGDGDEYFAELDYIEVAERLKEGYESDVQEDNESDEYVPEQDSDEEFNPRSSEKSTPPLVNTRNRTATAKRSNSNTTNGTNDDDDEQERQTINFVPNTQLENYEDITTKYKSMRRLFGKNEYCYIMDAKSIGNVGRYFNHSCSPNLFVQNVFVDTHDLRFPWVAFFALSNIRAGTELTWNYNYEVGVVPGKVLFCQCGAANCRGRLL